MRSETIEQPQKEASGGTFESGVTTYGPPEWVPMIPVLTEAEWFSNYQTKLTCDPTAWNKQYFK